MPRITEIRITEKKNLGNYESREFGISAVIEETESANESVDKLRKFVNYHLHKPERDKQLAEYSKAIQTLPAEQSAGHKAWIEKYQKFVAEMEQDWLETKFEVANEEAGAK